LKLARFQTLGRGTNGLRLTAPTFASTAPLSWPEYGLQNTYSNP
jgi:hypothetical protein